jgi:hypothetical protein
VISKILDYSRSPAEQVSQASGPSPASELTDIESAEKKLAVLVKTPKVERGA